MMTFIKTWLIGVLCAAMIVAIAEQLIPNGTIRKIAKLTGGLVLLLAILQPFVSMDEGELARAMEDYRATMSDYGDGLEEENSVLMKGIIAEQSGAYIVDKAAELGITCTAAVETEDGEEGYPLPYSVEIHGSLTGEERAALTAQITADFGIPAERQYYGGDGDGS
ncbi:MAG: stage III sporulation protein AF [Oscillospiraceae bacterium]|nr:stage III sporulation protein AF [Oscillospiraceae bacterium]